MMKMKAPVALALATLVVGLSSCSSGNVKNDATNGASSEPLTATTTTASPTTENRSDGDDNNHSRDFEKYGKAPNNNIDKTLLNVTRTYSKDGLIYGTVDSSVLGRNVIHNLQTAFAVAPIKAINRSGVEGIHIKGPVNSRLVIWRDGIVTRFIYKDPMTKFSAMQTLFKEQLAKGSPSKGASIANLPAMPEAEGKYTAADVFPDQDAAQDNRDEAVPPGTDMHF